MIVFQQKSAQRFSDHHVVIPSHPLRAHARDSGARSRVIRISGLGRGLPGGAVGGIAADDESDGEADHE